MRELITLLGWITTPFLMLWQKGADYFCDIGLVQSAIVFFLFVALQLAYFYVMIMIVGDFWNFIWMFF